MIESHGGEFIESIEFGNLRTLQTSPASAIAYATCLANRLAATSESPSLLELIPAPQLLALPELNSIEEFTAAMSDLDLNERATQKVKEEWDQYMANLSD